jgi:hypothetical protein
VNKYNKKLKAARSAADSTSDLEWQIEKVLDALKE